MNATHSPHRPAWTIAVLSVGLLAALVFGVLVLAGGDWLPGTIIVVASLAGLAGQLRLYRAARRS